MMLYTTNAAPLATAKTCRLGAAIPMENAPINMEKNTYNNDGFSLQHKLLIIVICFPLYFHIWSVLWDLRGTLVYFEGKCSLVQKHKNLSITVPDQTEKSHHFFRANHQTAHIKFYYYHNMSSNGLILAYNIKSLLGIVWIGFNHLVMIHSALKTKYNYFSSLEVLGRSVRNAYPSISPIFHLHAFIWKNGKNNRWAPLSGEP